MVAFATVSGVVPSPPADPIATAFSPVPTALKPTATAPEFDAFVSSPSAVAHLLAEAL